MREVVAARDLAGITTAVQRARSVANAIGQTLMDEAQAAADSARAQAAAEVAQAAAAAQAEAEAPRGKVLTVFSTKGGVGKSLVATNLGVALADSRPLGLPGRPRRQQRRRGDHAAAHAPPHDQRPGRLQRRHRRRGHRLDPHPATPTTSRSSRRRCASTPPTRPPQDDIAKLLDALRRMVDFVVVDTSGIFDDHALCALDRSDAIVLVGTLDIPSLKALKLATSTLEVLNFPKSTWRFVLNRADGKVGLTVEEYEKTLGLKADSLPRLEPRGPRGGQPGRGPGHRLSQPPQLQGPRRVRHERGRPASATPTAPARAPHPAGSPSGSRLRLRRA